MERYLDRLPVIQDFEKDVCDSICEEYGFGKFKSYMVVTKGYEDFNFILTAEKGKYFVKLFSKQRKEEDCRRIARLMELLIENKVHHPPLYKTKSGSSLHEIKVDEVKVLLCVMEYIDGKDFFELKVTPSQKEIQQLAIDLAHVNSLSFPEEIPHLYDSWAIPNFEREYEKKKEHLEETEREILDPILTKFRAIPFDDLPQALVHGDVLPFNVIRDKKGILWIVDFSVANIYPRLLEIAIIATHLLFDTNSKDNTSKNFKTFIDEYTKYIELTEDEIKYLPVFIECSYAIEFMNTVYEKRVRNNKSEENGVLMKEAKIGLEWGTEIFDF